MWMLTAQSCYAQIMNDPRIRLAQKLYRIAKQTGLLAQVTRMAPTLIPRLAPLAAVAGTQVCSATMPANVRHEPFVFQAMRYVPVVIGFVALPIGLVFGTIGYNAEKAVRKQAVAEDADPGLC
jgi:hypothetical protein